MDSPSFDDSSIPESSFEIDNKAGSRRSRGWTGLAWISIMITIGLIILPYQLTVGPDSAEPSTILFEMQARCLVGAATVAVQEESVIELQLSQMFDHGSVRQRLIGAVLRGELIAPEKAEESLENLQTQIAAGSLKASDRDQEAIAFLSRMQAALIDETPLNEAFIPDEFQSARALLRERLGWVGRLAMTPPGSTDRQERDQLQANARRTFFVMMGASGLAILMAVVGVVLQIVWWMLLFMGYFHSGMTPLRGDGGIYAETFAVWMAAFLALNFAMMYLPLPNKSLVWVMVPQIGGLGALAWPLLRGLRWSDVRQDIGLTFQPQAWSAPFVGIAAYLAALPVVGVATLVMFLMMAIASQFSGDGGESATPAHPIVEQILRGTWTVRLQLLCVAVFAAVPEEIMFRGVLYRHLREASSRWGYVGSVAFATLISSFVFAVIHPQGLFGIPILMGLAIVFALIREWRGSLVPCMITHALVNAGTSTLLLLMAD